MKHKDPWFAGFNFPLGQPNVFLKKAILPEKWSSYVKNITRWKKVLSYDGGDITVQSVEGEGSTFTIEMPVKVVPKATLRRWSSDLA